jgi:hypothetical protein
MIVIPSLGNPDLAYETGFHLGDGSLGHYSRYSYRYCLSGNRVTEYGFYRDQLIPLIRDLFGLTPSLSTYGNSVYATIYSKALVLFKAEVLGLEIGRKSHLFLPRPIISQGRTSLGEVISGLFDADASLKKRKTSSGVYPRLSIAQKFRQIVEQTKHALSTDFGISSTMYLNDYFDPRVSKHELRWFLEINGFENLAKFESQIGSRHPVMMKRIENFLSMR